MPRQTGGKLKILYVRDILEQAHREGRTITMREIIERLQTRGITAERKSVADDLRLLRQYGLPVLCIRRGRATAYTLEKSAKTW